MNVLLIVCLMTKVYRKAIQEVICLTYCEIVLLRGIYLIIDIQKAGLLALLPGHGIF